MYNPLVSIIIPVYNGTNYLKESIDCSLEQTYKNIEIIIVNDGSTDNGETEKLIYSYKNKVRYFKKENGGSSSALNVGIDNMLGEWFSWLSHDDLYYPQKIEDQIELLRTKLKVNPKIDLKKQVIYTNSEMIDKNGKLLFKWKNRKIEGLSNLEIMIEALKVIKLNGCSFLLNKECFFDIGNFREDMKLLNDFEYWYRLLYNNYNFNYIPEILVQGRMHSAQVSNTIEYSKDNWEQDEFWERLINYTFASSNVKKGEYLFRIGKYALLNGRRIDANKSFEFAKNISAKYRLIIPIISVNLISYCYIRELIKKIYINMFVRK
ncbi:glycosyltransferase [Acetobacterium bakii]|uniref:glycosyltransferase n=1 Tax=Acetobacterium bakii TaxID=52689 RepID=UPI000680FD6D|nr:glycosyltransferase [Acetobacterium bakii]